MTPDAKAPRDASTAAPGDSLETFMAKVRKLSTEATVDRPDATSVETAYPSLGEAILAARLQPSPEAYRTVAHEYWRIRIFDKAHEYLNKARLLSSTDAATYDALARLWRDSGFPHLGLGDAHRAVYYAPGSPIVHNTLGTVFQALGRRALARGEYRRALEIDPSAAYALNNLCYGWMLDGDAPKAVAACERALELHPEMAAARNNLGLAHAVAGNGPAARAAFEGAGDAAQAHYNAGIVNLARGQYKSAVKSFEAAQSARPTLAMAAERARQASARVRAAQMSEE